MWEKVAARGFLLSWLKYEGVTQEIVVLLITKPQGKALALASGRQIKSSRVVTARADITEAEKSQQRDHVGISLTLR